MQSIGRILLVEDHRDTAVVITRLLRRLQYEVLHAATAAAALEIAEDEMCVGGIDLILCDIGLPDGSGLEVMKVLSAKYKLRGIAVSGFGMEVDREQSAKAGFSRHLTKPMNISILRHAISDVTRDPK